MWIFWIIIGFALLYVGQRGLYMKCWDEKLRVQFCFTESAVTEGEAAGILERVENRKYLSLPTFGYRYSVRRNYAALTREAEKNQTLRRKLALPGRRASVNRAKIQGLTRGLYTLEEVTLFGEDLFHTVNMELPMNCSSQLTVYPSKIPARKLELPARQLLGALVTRRMIQEDPFALKSIRPYEIYDSPRLINWKASARTGELKVNQFEHTTDEALLFLLDLGSGDEEAKEELLRLASSLSLLFLRRGVSVSLLANCRNCVTGKPIRVKAGGDLGHQIAVDEALAHISLGTPITAPFGDFLASLPQAALRAALPVALSADDSGQAFRAFRTTPGARGGCFLGVNGGEGMEKLGGVTLLNWSEPEEEVGA